MMDLRMGFHDRFSLDSKYLGGGGWAGSVVGCLEAWSRRRLIGSGVRQRTAQRPPQVSRLGALLALRLLLQRRLALRSGRLLLLRGGVALLRRVLQTVAAACVPAGGEKT